MTWGETRARAVPHAEAILARRGLELRPEGKLQAATCPFHSDGATPSLKVYPDGGFHCFGCGAHGDLFDLVAHLDGVEPAEAVRRVAAEAGLPVPQGRKPTAEEVAARDHREAMFRALEASARFFHDQLRSGRSRGAAACRAYVEERCLQEAVEPWTLGYAPPGRSLIEHLERQGIPQDIRTAAGITALSDDGHEYPRFRDRLMVPILDHQNQVVSFCGRILPFADIPNRNGRRPPKYQNGPKTAVFDKGAVSFGLGGKHGAARAIRKTGRALLVEGHLDVIALHLAGFGAAIGLQGSALTRAQAEALVRTGCRDAVLIPDGDGRVNLERVLAVALKAELPLRIVELPAGEGDAKWDPDTVVRADRGPWGDRPGREWLAEEIESGPDAFVVLLDRLAAEAPGPQAVAKALTKAVIPLLGRVPIAARGPYLKAIESRFGVTADEIRAELAASGSAPPRPPPRGTPPPGETDPAVAKLNRRHFVVSVGGQTLVGTERIDPALGRVRLDLSSFVDFRNLYSNQTVEIPDPRRPNRIQNIELGKYWLQHPNRRQFSGLVFLPGKPREVDGCLNLWRGFAVEPRPGSCERYKAHVRDVICNGDDRLFWWVWRWLAHAVQRTDELPKSAIVLRGLQGVGKNAFVDPFGRLFGQHFITLSWMEHLVGRFSGHLADAIVIHANEATWGFDRQREGALKSMVTDHKVAVEHKMRDLIQLPNFRRLIVSTNRSTPVARDLDDRRFLVLDVGEKHKEDTTYFRALFDELEHGGLSALLPDLLRTDLTGFVPWEVPQTSGGFDIKLRTAGPVIQWWFELLQEGCNAEGDTGPPFWDECPLVEALHASLVRWCQRHGVRRIPTREELGRDLRRLAPHVGVFRPRSPDRRRRYRLGGLEECRRTFETHAKAGPWLWEGEGDDTGEF